MTALVAGNRLTLTLTLTQELMTADGKKVQERRHTAWLAEGGIGALAYSGKLMAPHLEHLLVSQSFTTTLLVNSWPTRGPFSCPPS